MSEEQLDEYRMACRKKTKMALLWQQTKKISTQENNRNSGFVQKWKDIK